MFFFVVVVVVFAFFFLFVVNFVINWNETAMGLHVHEMFFNLVFPAACF